MSSSNSSSSSSSNSSSNSLSNRPSQQERAERFRALHEMSAPFVIANAWDAGSARILAGMGFSALATSSGAAAGVLGRLDGNISRDEALTQIRSMVDAIDVPLAGDLEKGYGDDPNYVAETIRLAADAGLVGGSIEDATGRREQPLFDFNLAVERVTAAAQAARKLAFPFVLTARTENYLRGNPDLDDTIKRLQAFERAGADVLFAPGLPTLDAVRTVCQSVNRPVNFMVAIPGRSFSVAELAAAGVKRISLATSLYRAALTGMVRAAREVVDQGTFNFLSDLASPQETSAHMRR